jgi:ketosteroid isomerase-like protein
VATALAGSNVAPMDAAPKEIVEELARRFSTGDRDGARRLFHPGLRIQQPESLPHGGWHEGLDGMDAMGAAFARHWDRTIADTVVLGCGETVVQVTTQTWTAKVTGRSATVDVVELFSFADGLVAEIRVFQQDTHLLLGTLDDR